jgi:hypothetical protein
LQDPIGFLKIPTRSVEARRAYIDGATQSFFVLVDELRPNTRVRAELAQTLAGQLHSLGMFALPEEKDVYAEFLLKHYE